MIVPEKAETIGAQLRWLAEGKRRAVLLTPGAALPALREEWGTVNTRAGLFVYRLSSITADDIAQAVERDEIGLVLDYGVPRKPENPVGALVLRGADGIEKVAVVVDDVTQPTVWRHLLPLCEPDDTLELEHPAVAVGQRLGLGTFPGWPELRRVDANGAAELMRQATASGASTMGPTHAVLRDGQLIGSLGIGPMNVMRAWLKRDVKPATSQRVMAQAELLIREQGLPVCWLMLEPGSPFNGVMERWGWKAVGQTVVWRKEF